MWLEGRGFDEGDSRAFTDYHAHLLQSIRLRASLDRSILLLGSWRRVLSSTSSLMLVVISILDRLPIIRFAEYIGLSRVTVD